MTPTVHAGPQAATSPGPFTSPAESPLRRRYEAYRKREARALLEIVPREALRTLLREARSGDSTGAGLDDPIELLVTFCERMLPLPPFEVWLADFQENRSAYLAVEDLEARGPRAAGPVAVALRSFPAGGETWHAALEVSPGADTWTGHLRFHAETRPERAFRTGDVFRGADAEAVRQRFDEFDIVTLQAFLRSVLP